MAVRRIVIAYLMITSSIAEVIKQEKVYGLRGGSVELAVEQLPEGTKVTSIVWKYGKDKVADWVVYDGEDVTYYAKFKSNSTLNKKTWDLKIADLQPSHSGMYSAEVNNKDTTKEIHLIVLNNVSIPNITKECNSTSCTLICEGEEREHTQYSWTDNKGNRNSGDRWTVDKSSAGQDVVFTCNFSNPVSWKTSNVSLEDGYSLEIIIIGIGIVLVIIVGIVLAIVIHRCCRKRHGAFKPGTEGLSGEVAYTCVKNDGAELSPKIISQQNNETPQGGLKLSEQNGISSSEPQTDEPAEKAAMILELTSLQENETHITSVENGGVTRDLTPLTLQDNITNEGENDTLNQTATETDGGSDSVQEQKGETDNTVENGDETQDVTPQQHTNVKLPNSEMSEEEVEKGKSPALPEDDIEGNSSSPLCEKDSQVLSNGPAVEDEIKKNDSQTNPDKGYLSQRSGAIPRTFGDIASNAGPNDTTGFGYFLGSVE